MKDFGDEFSSNDVDSPHKKKTIHTKHFSFITESQLDGSFVPFVANID